MGTSKASLAWHGSTLVRRVAGIVARGVGGPVVLVRSPGQSLPSLPAAFEVLEDIEEGKGPLGGLSVGLEALAGRCEAAYVSSTDVPFLHPAFVRRVVGELGAGVDACVPCVRGFRQPLAAVYRAGLAPTVKSLLSSDRLRVALLLEACSWKELDEAALLADPGLARFDPGLESVTNLNDPQEYETATAQLQPLVQLQWRDAGGPLGGGPPARATLRAATLGGAAEAIGLDLGSGLEIALNGDLVSPDPEEPLAEGDVVCFARAATLP
jgi:molybdopterin-guanine dinucleotide biosynthesis protein A